MLWRGWTCGCTRFYVDDQHWYRWLLLIDVFASVGIDHDFLVKGVSAFWTLKPWPRWRLKRMVGKRYRPSKQKGLRYSVFLPPTELCCQWAAHEPLRPHIRQRKRSESNARFTPAKSVKKLGMQRDWANFVNACDFVWENSRGGPIRFLHVPNTEAGRCKNNYILGQTFLIILYKYI